MICELNYCSKMEDEIKIFIAGARKIYELKEYTQADIYKGIKWPPGLKGSQGTISSYFVGRTKPKKPIRKAIANFLETTYEEILEIGRKELAKQTGTIQESDLEELVTKKIKAELEKSSGRKLPDDRIELEHYAVIRDFPERIREKALEMNQLAVKLTKIAPDSIDDIIDYIEHKLNKHVDRTPIKKAANGSGESQAI